MKEREIVVKDAQLALMWYRQGVFAFDNIINMININNMVYGFNLLDNDEELSVKAQEHKMAIKYKNICLPLMSALEEMLKSVLIAHRYLQSPTTFNRNNVNHEIIRNVRREENAPNAHDFFAMINYIIRHVDPQFLTRIANEYAMARDHKMIFDNPLSRNSKIDFETSEERVQAATQEYTQGFIEFRYLFEKSETYDKNVDLTKLVQYGYAIQECCSQLLVQMRAMDSLDSPQSVLSGVGGIELSTAISKKVDNAVDEAFGVVGAIMRDAGVDFDGIIRKYKEKYLGQLTNGVSTSDFSLSFPIESCLLKYGGVIKDGNIPEQVKDDSSNLAYKIDMLLRPSTDLSGVDEEMFVPIQEIANTTALDAHYYNELGRLSGESLSQAINDLLAKADDGLDDNQIESLGVKK